MPLLGAHMSIAGGYYKAVEAAAELGMQTVQLFTKNNNQWRARPISDDEAELFRESVQRTGIRQPCAHDSYLINLASPRKSIWKKSLQAFIVELQRAEQLGLSGLVMHPGSHLDSDEQTGLARVVEALDIALEETDRSAVEIWIENTAGQGTNLGWRFEHLQYLIENVADNRRVGVCLDSCHLFAAGYAISERSDYLRTIKEFNRLVGLERIRAFHLNDSKRELGSRVDRHEHIGQGHLGLEPFRHILNDRRFARLPMYLETPKSKKGHELDAMNYATLRSLLRSKR